MSTITHTTIQSCLPLPPFFKLPHTLRAPNTMATTTASLTPFSTLTHTKLLFTFLAALLLTSPIPSNSFLSELRVFDISPVPAFLPIEPTTSSIPPTWAPDMMPLFPSPGGKARVVPATALPNVSIEPEPAEPRQVAAQFCDHSIL